MTTWLPLTALALIGLAVLVVAIDRAAAGCGHLYRRWLTTHRPPNPPEPDNYEDTWR